MQSTKMSSVYKFINYKEYLEVCLADISKRGQKSALADALCCQSSYISRILNGDAHFSPEQASLAAKFFELDPDEANFFLLLVLKARSGSTALTEILNNQIGKIHEDRLKMKNRLVLEETVGRPAHDTYYSAWYYTAIHMALRIPDLKTSDSISKYLKLSPKIVDEVLTFFVKNNIAKKNESGFELLVAVNHLDDESPLKKSHHRNWRLKTIEDMGGAENRSVHYSSVASLSKSDARVIKEIFLDAIEKSRASIKESPDETLICYACDVFELSNEF